jgi:hypothetical protein
MSGTSDLPTQPSGHSGPGMPKACFAEQSEIELLRRRANALSRSLPASAERAA